MYDDDGAGRPRLPAARSLMATCAQKAVCKERCIDPSAQDYAVRPLAIVWWCHAGPTAARIQYRLGNFIVAGTVPDHPNFTVFVDEVNDLPAVRAL
jgi:hypothetical protein